MKHWTILAVELCKYRVYIYYNIDSILLLGLSCVWKSNLWEVPVNPGAVFSSNFQDEKLLTRAFNVIVQLLILWVCNLKCVWEFHPYLLKQLRGLSVICWMSHLLHVTYRINHRAYLVIIFQYGTLNSHLEIDWRITNDDIWYWYRSLKKRQDVVPKQEFDEKW